MSRPVANILAIAAAAIAAFAASPALPSPTLTPGATMTVPLRQLCSKGYASSVRHVSGRTKAAVFKEYRIPKSQHYAYEVDHLIPLELGGSNDIKNLWPQPYAGEWNAHDKDALEDRLHETICRADRSMSLAEAQRAIRTDWIVTYKRVFKTELPLK